MGIANIFCQSLGMTSHSKTFLTVCRFQLDQVSFCFNSSGYPLKKNCHPFERLGLSVRGKLLSVQTAQAICSKKNLSTVRATEAICSKINFSRVSIPKPFRRQPLASNDLLFSRSRTLRSLFTNASYMKQLRISPPSQPS